MQNGARGGLSCPRCEQEDKQADRQLALLHERLAAREVEHQRTLAEARAELLSRNEKLTQQLEALTREKDGMVVRYATSEKEVIVARKALDEADKRLRDLAKERDQYFSRVRSLSQERSRLCASLDTKLAELARLHKEQERLRDDLASRDIKIKWAQNKLRTEVDAHKETQGRLEQAHLRLRDLREEADQVRKDCHEMLRRQDSPDSHRDELDQLRQRLEGSLDEKAALAARVTSEFLALIWLSAQNTRWWIHLLMRSGCVGKEWQPEGLEGSGCSLRVAESGLDRVQVEQLEQERSEQEQTVARLRQELDDKAGVELQLTRCIKAEASQAEAERLGQAAAEAQADLEACHQKEAELLLFTEQLTSRSVQLQSDHSLLSLRVPGSSTAPATCLGLVCLLSLYRPRIQGAPKVATERVTGPGCTLSWMARPWRLLVEMPAETTRGCKHRCHISFVAFPLSCYQTRVRIINEMKLNKLGRRKDSATRVHSSSSPALRRPTARIATSDSMTLLGGGGPPETQPDVQLLLERIVRLQKSLARKKDKLDFLEEHVGHLVLELKNKSRIIQNYVAREEAGALTPSSMDCNKEELSRRGGIMASVFGSQPLDAGMTLELSLEMNRKLQLVLEDTLLKNITLKESMDTLGQEIARLT
ncbi:unnamed protein product [Ixodes hexagonus]